jgi:N-acyl-D-amino-acid deacylase
MVRIVARRGGLYASHIRNEEAYLLEAVDEAINIGRRTGARVQISHLKAAGRANWSRQHAAIGMIESARSEGVEVYADAYPYTAYSTGLTVVLESWVRDGGTSKILERIKDPSTREKIRKEVDHRITTNDPGGYDLIVISSLSSEKNKNCIGKNLLQIAEMWKVEPVDAYLRLLEEEDASVGYVGHGMSPENVELVLSHPLVMVSTDGYSIAPEGKALESQPHPRSYGTYPRFLGYYTRERKIVDLPTAIKKMTSMPATQCGLKNRGRIAKGHKADLVAFDANKIKEISSFDQPHRFPEGIAHVFVNGVQVVKNGAHTNARPGQILRI